MKTIDCNRFDLVQTCDVNCSSKEYLDIFLGYESSIYGNTNSSCDSNVAPSENIFLLDEDNVDGVKRAGNSGSNCHKRWIKSVCGMNKNGYGLISLKEFATTMGMNTDNASGDVATNFISHNLSADATSDVRGRLFSTIPLLDACVVLRIGDDIVESCPVSLMVDEVKTKECGKDKKQLIISVLSYGGELTVITVTGGLYTSCLAAMVQHFHTTHINIMECVSSPSPVRTSKHCTIECRRHRVLPSHLQDTLYFKTAQHITSKQCVLGCSDGNILLYTVCNSSGHVVALKTLETAPTEKDFSEPVPESQVGTGGSGGLLWGVSSLLSNILLGSGSGSRSPAVGLGPFDVPRDCISSVAGINLHLHPHISHTPCTLLASVSTSGRLCLFSVCGDVNGTDTHIQSMPLTDFTASSSSSWYGSKSILVPLEPEVDGSKVQGEGTSGTKSTTHVPYKSVSIHKLLGIDSECGWEEKTSCSDRVAVTDSTCTLSLTPTCMDSDSETDSNACMFILKLTLGVQLNDNDGGQSQWRVFSLFFPITYAHRTGRDGVGRSLIIDCAITQLIECVDADETGCVAEDGDVVVTNSRRLLEITHSNSDMQLLWMVGNQMCLSVYRSRAYSASRDKGLHGSDSDDKNVVHVSKRQKRSDSDARPGGDGAIEFRAMVTSVEHQADREGRYVCYPRPGLSLVSTGIGGPGPSGLLNELFYRQDKRVYEVCNTQLESELVKQWCDACLEELRLGLEYQNTQVSYKSASSGTESVALDTAGMQRIPSSFRVLETDDGSSLAMSIGEVQSDYSSKLLLSVQKKITMQVVTTLLQRLYAPGRFGTDRDQWPNGVPGDMFCGNNTNVLQRALFILEERFLSSNPDAPCRHEHDFHNPNDVASWLFDVYSSTHFDASICTDKYDAHPSSLLHSVYEYYSGNSSSGMDSIQLHPPVATAPSYRQSFSGLRDTHQLKPLPPVFTQLLPWVAILLSYTRSYMTLVDTCQELLSPGLNSVVSRVGPSTLTVDMKDAYSLIISHSRANSTLLVLPTNERSLNSNLNSSAYSVGAMAAEIFEALAGVESDISQTQWAQIELSLYRLFAAPVESSLGEDWISSHGSTSDAPPTYLPITQSYSSMTKVVTHSVSSLCKTLVSNDALAKRCAHLNLTADLLEQIYKVVPHKLGAISAPSSIPSNCVDDIFSQAQLLGSVIDTSFSILCNALIVMHTILLALQSDIITVDLSTKKALLRALKHDYIPRLSSILIYYSFLRHLRMKLCPDTATVKSPANPYMWDCVAGSEYVRARNCYLSTVGRLRDVQRSSIWDVFCVYLFELNLGSYDTKKDCSGGYVHLTWLALLNTPVFSVLNQKKEGNYSKAYASDSLFDFLYHSNQCKTLVGYVSVRLAWSCYDSGASCSLMEMQLVTVQHLSMLSLCSQSLKKSDDVYTSSGMEVVEMYRHETHCRHLVENLFAYVHMLFPVAVDPIVVGDVCEPYSKEILQTLQDCDVDLVKLIGYVCDNRYGSLLQCVLVEVFSDKVMHDPLTVLTQLDSGNANIGAVHGCLFLQYLYDIVQHMRADTRAETGRNAKSMGAGLSSTAGDIWSELKSLILIRCGESAIDCLQCYQNKPSNSIRSDCPDYNEEEIHIQSQECESVSRTSAFSSKTCTAMIRTDYLPALYCQLIDTSLKLVYNLDISNKTFEYLLSMMYLLHPTPSAGTGTGFPMATTSTMISEGLLDDTQVKVLSLLMQQCVNTLVCYCVDHHHITLLCSMIMEGNIHGNPSNAAGSGNFSGMVNAVRNEGRNTAECSKSKPYSSKTLPPHIRGYLLLAIREQLELLAFSTTLSNSNPNSVGHVSADSVSEGHTPSQIPYTNQYFDTLVTVLLYNESFKEVARVMHILYCSSTAPSVEEAGCRTFMDLNSISHVLTQRMRSLTVAIAALSQVPQLTQQYIVKRHVSVVAVDKNGEMELETDGSGLSPIDAETEAATVTSLSLVLKSDLRFFLLIHSIAQQFQLCASDPGGECVDLNLLINVTTTHAANEAVDVSSVVTLVVQMVSQLYSQALGGTVNCAVSSAIQLLVRAHRWCLSKLLKESQVELGGSISQPCTPHYGLQPLLQPLLDSMALCVHILMTLYVQVSSSSDTASLFQSPHESQLVDMILHNINHNCGCESTTDVVSDPISHYDLDYGFILLKFIVNDVLGVLEETPIVSAMGSNWKLHDASLIAYCKNAARNVQVDGNEVVNCLFRHPVPRALVRCYLHGEKITEGDEQSSSSLVATPVDRFVRILLKHNGSVVQCCEVLSAYYGGLFVFDGSSTQISKKCAPVTVTDLLLDQCAVILCENILIMHSKQILHVDAKYLNAKGHQMRNDKVTGYGNGMLAPYPHPNNPNPKPKEGMQNLCILDEALLSSIQASRAEEPHCEAFLALYEAYLGLQIALIQYYKQLYISELVA